MSETRSFDKPRADYWEQVRPLGDVRCRVLQCMTADDPRVAAYFAPRSSGRLRDALLSHLEELWTRFGSDMSTRRILAAGLMTFGRLDMAEVILGDLPPQRIVLDHGAGRCRLLPYQVAAELLPLPETLRDPALWIEGTREAQELRAWFARGRDSLRWDAEREHFR